MHSKKAFRAVFEYIPASVGGTEGLSFKLHSLSIPFRLDTIRKKYRPILAFEHVTDLRVYFRGDIPQTIQVRSKGAFWKSNARVGDSHRTQPPPP